MFLEFINNQYLKIKHLIHQAKLSRIEKNRQLFYSRFLPQSELDFINEFYLWYQKEIN